MKEQNKLEMPYMVFNREVVQISELLYVVGAFQSCHNDVTDGSETFLKIQ